MSLTHEQLAESCKKNNITCLVCEQDYFATKEDALNDHPDFAEDDEALKVDVMYRMLQENLDYGELMETEEEIDSVDHGLRMEGRDKICYDVAQRWASGEYSTKECTEPEMYYAQRDTTIKVNEWFGMHVLNEMADLIMSKTNDDIVISDFDVAEYLGKRQIIKFFKTTCAKTVGEFVDEVMTGLSGSPLDGCHVDWMNGQPFSPSDAESFARQYWESHK